MAGLLGLSGFAGFVRLFRHPYNAGSLITTKSSPENTTELVRYGRSLLTESTVFRLASEVFDFDVLLACPIDNCSCGALDNSFGFHKDIYLEGSNERLNLQDPKDLCRYIGYRTHNTLPLWNTEHSSKMIWATILSWDCFVPAFDVPTTQVDVPSIIVTEHDDIDHDHVDADEHVIYSLSRRWTPRIEAFSWQYKAQVAVSLRMHLHKVEDEAEDARIENRERKIIQFEMIHDVNGVRSVCDPPVNPWTKVTPGLEYSCEEGMAAPWSIEYGYHEFDEGFFRRDELADVPSTSIGWSLMDGIAPDEAELSLVTADPLLEICDGAEGEGTNKRPRSVFSVTDSLTDHGMKRVRAEDSGYTSGDEVTAARQAQLEADREFNAKLADMIAAVDWDDDEYALPT